MFAKRLERRIGFVMMPGIIAGLTILSVVSVTFAGVIGTQLTGLEASKISLQTQQFAESKANEIGLLPYDSIATTEMTRQAITGTPYQREVLVGTEISLEGGVKQRTVTINIYKSAEAKPRFSLEKTISTLEKESSSAIQVETGVNSLYFVANNKFEKITLLASSMFSPSDGTWSGYTTCYVYINGTYIGYVQPNTTTWKSGNNGHYWGTSEYAVKATSFNYIVPKGASIQISIVGSSHHNQTNFMVILSK